VFFYFYIYFERQLLWISRVTLALVPNASRKPVAFIFLWLQVAISFAVSAPEA
jgi:hypothetical protein